MKKTRVPSHFRRTSKGKKVKVKGFSRKPKPKKRTGIHKAEKVTLRIQYYKDDQGRLVGKRTVTRL